MAARKNKKGKTMKAIIMGIRKNLVDKEVEKDKEGEGLIVGRLR